MMDVKVSKDKHNSRWVDKGPSAMLDERELKTVHKDEEVIDREKRSKTLTEAKTVENIAKNPQSFLEIRL